MQVVRIIGVWLVTLAFVSWIYGGGSKGFLLVFVTYGMFLTVPALVILGVAYVVETAIILHGQRWIAVAVGPVMGLLAPLALIAIAPNKANAINGALLLFPLTVGTGVLWSASFLLLRRHRSR